MVKTYAFQQHLTLVVDAGNKSPYAKYFDNEYVRIDQTDVSTQSPTSSVTLRIVDEIPGDLAPEAIRRKERFKKMFTFEYAVVGLGTEHAVVYFVDHWISRLYVTAVGVFVQAQVLEPVMYLSFLQQRILFMHSAGVSRDEKAYVFPAHGGTGKTTMCMNLVAKGYKFMGDDLLIVDPASDQVFAYPRPLHIFTYNVRNLSGAVIPRRISAVIYFKNVLRFVLERVLRTEFLISTRIHADEILPDLELSKPARIHHVVFLKKEGAHEHIDVTDPTVRREHAAAIVDSADLNESLFRILDDPVRQAEIRELELDVAGAVLEAADEFGYLNTRAIDLADAEDLVLDLSGL